MAPFRPRSVLGLETPSSSSPEFATNAAATARESASPWIVNGRADFVFFIGTPFLILPLILVAERVGAASQLCIAVAAFGALGHQLPGMLHAYGQRALHERFRTRLVVAPILLLSACIVLTCVDPRAHALTLIIFTWGVWHVLMQTQRFLRLYDTRSGSSESRWTSRLDLWMCVSWFAAAVLFSQSRLHHILESFYGVGGPGIPMGWIQVARVAWGTLTATVTLVYVAHAIARWRAGSPPSAVKLLLLLTSVAFWVYSCAIVRNLIVGLVMFEIFHDVQYLAVVWRFSRDHALRTLQEGCLGRSLSLCHTSVALYVGLVLAYGSLYFVNLELQRDTSVFAALLAASALLHFYYDGFIWDGFIWNGRESASPKASGPNARTRLRRAGARFPWLAHSARWMPFVAAFAGALVLYSRPATSESQARVLLGSAFPDYDIAQAQLAAQLHAAGDLDSAIEVDRHLLALKPGDARLVAATFDDLKRALVERALQLVRRGDEHSARALAREAFALDTGLPSQLSKQATELLQTGHALDAIPRYRVALLMAPSRAHVHMQLALALAAENRMAEALEHAQRAQRSIPQDETLIRLVRQIEAQGRRP